MDQKEVSNNAEPQTSADYLTPDQRLDAVADILNSIALRLMKKNREQQ